MPTADYIHNSRWESKKEGTPRDGPNSVLMDHSNMVLS